MRDKTVSTAEQTADWLTGGGEMGALMRAMDWELTPLGPIDSWSPTLKMMARFLLVNRFPLLLWWGPEFCQLYNDAYRPILGTKHPHFLGRSVSECWSEIWHILRPLIETPFNGGPATWMEDILLEINRYGFMEETHFTIAYSPVPDETVPSGIGGVLATVHEISEKVVGERRIVVLRDLSARAADVKTAEQACAAAAAMLAKHPNDVPFALLYLIDPDGQRARLAGAAGVSPGSPTSPLVIELNEQFSKEQAWPLADTLRNESLQIVDDLAGRFGDAVPPGPWSDPPRQAVVTPIRSNIAHQLAGMLVTGISSRLRLDDSYRSFIELAAGQIATAIANARAYEEERKRAEALAEIDRAKTAFFSNVSHEFRTPLTLMLGPLEDALAEDGLAPGTLERLDVVHRNSRRLLKLVNNLLDFSRIEAGRTEAIYEQVDLAAYTTDLASVFRSAVEKAGMMLIVDCPPLPEAVYIDREMWEKIVLNLLSNAFKFTFQGEINVRLRPAGDMVELEVSDTGTGIPAEELSHLFERFHRVKGSRGRSYEGSGIGLALVLELVKLHGGSVRVTSEINRGSKFIVSIPAGKAHLPADRIRAERTLASTGMRGEAFLEEALRWLPEDSPADEFAAEVGSEALGKQEWIDSSANSGQSARQRILVADDNADMREYLLRRLAQSGYEVVGVGDGEAALTATREQSFDLVLTDVMMPKLDGFGLLTTLRADERTRAIPVIMLSARAGEESRVEGLEAGADDYLIKPFSARELMAKVESSLKLAQLRREEEERTAADLHAMKLLHEVGNFCARASNDFEKCLDQIVATAIALTGADKGNIQLLDTDTRNLRIAAQRGFAEPFLKFFNRVNEGKAAAPGVRVIVEDVTRSEIFAGQQPALDVLLDAGVRALQSTPLVSSSGQVLGMISTHFRMPRCPSERDLRLIDLLARQTADYLERRTADEALREADRRKDEFLATLAHELRNPLAPLHNGLQLIRLSENNPATLNQARAMMERQLQQLKRLVDDLLDISRISRNKLELRKEFVELTTVVKSATETSRPLIEAADQALLISLPLEPLLVDADPVRLAQAFSNLLNNAAKYSERGGRIWFTVEEEAEEAVIRVKDTGIGIPASELRVIFDMFVQVDLSLERSQGGLGIGLTLVKQLIQMHGGSIEALSDGPGKGSEFIIRLPLVVVPRLAPTTKKEVEDETPAKVGHRILVVDDNRDSAESLAMMLELLGHNVSCAHDGLEAVETAKKFLPELVFLDVGMPKMNGYDAARVIRQQKECRDVILVALTGWGQEEDRRRSYEAGFNFHMVKPIDFYEVEKLIAEL